MYDAPVQQSRHVRISESIGMELNTDRRTDENNEKQKHHDDCTTSIMFDIRRHDKTYPLNEPRAARRLNCDAAVTAEVVVVVLLWPIDVRMVIREKSTDLVFLIVESGDFGVCACIWLSHSICLPLELTRSILFLWKYNVLRKCAVVAGVGSDRAFRCIRCWTKRKSCETWESANREMQFFPSSLLMCVMAKVSMKFVRWHAYQKY